MILEDFIKFLSSLSIYLKSGFSVKNSILNVYQMENLDFSDTFEKELIKLKNKLFLNLPVTLALVEFSNSLNVKEIIKFTKILNESYYEGGNLVVFVDDTHAYINRKLENRKTIELKFFDKKIEQYILFSLPFVLLILFNFIAYNYIKVLYENIIGRLIVSIGTFFLVLSYYLFNKIIEEVK